MADKNNSQGVRGPLERWKDPSPVTTAIALFLLVDMLAAAVVVPLGLLHVIPVPVWAIILVTPGVMAWILVLGALVSSLFKTAPRGSAAAAPEDMRQVMGPEAMPDWGEDGPPIRISDGVHHRIEGTSQHDRPYMLLATGTPSLTTWHLLLRLPGWLPNLTVRPQFANIPGLERDAAKVEDYEFNRRYDITSFDRTADGQRYAHAFFHPRMMEYLLSIPPASFDVRGEWLVSDVPGDSADDALAHHGPVLERLETIADGIPRMMYRVYTDRELRLRCRAANELNRAREDRRPNQA